MNKIREKNDNRGFWEKNSKKIEKELIFRSFFEGLEIDKQIFLYYNIGMRVAAGRAPTQQAEGGGRIFQEVSTARSPTKPKFEHFAIAALAYMMKTAGGDSSAAKPP